MARVTVEDCIDKEKNRFKLTLLAAMRARQLARGAPPIVDDKDDKFTVTALREIAAGLDLDQLEEAMIKRYQNHFIFDDEEEDMEDTIDLMAGEGEWVGTTQTTEEALSKSMQIEEFGASEESGSGTSDTSDQDIDFGNASFDDEAGASSN